MKKALVVVVLFLFGSACLVGFGALVHVRMGHDPFGVSEPLPRASEDGRPLQALRRGSYRSVESALRHLVKDERSQATHAMDAAMRATRVGEHAACGMERRSFSRAFSDVERARRLLQKGQEQDAMELLVVAAAALAHGASPSAGCAASEASIPPLDLERYQDARLLDERGMRIGEVIGVERNQATELVLVVGGVRDFFGFLDFGGRETRVPASALVFGAHGIIGETLVVMPTSGS